jgi:hypothetical protein
MATIINNPDSSSDGGGAGLVTGIIIAVVIVFLFLVFGLPAIRGNGNRGTTVNVPDKVNVDVNKN